MSGWLVSTLLLLGLVAMAIWTRYLWGPAIIHTTLARGGHLDIVVTGTATLVRDERAFAAPAGGVISHLVDDGTLVIAGSDVVSIQGHDGRRALEVQAEIARSQLELMMSQRDPQLGAQAAAAPAVLDRLVRAVSAAKRQSAVEADLAQAAGEYADWKRLWWQLAAAYAEGRSAIEDLAVQAAGDGLLQVAAPVRGFVSYRHDGWERALGFDLPLPEPAVLDGWRRPEPVSIQDGGTVEVGEPAFRIASPELVGFYLVLESEAQPLSGVPVDVVVRLASGTEIPARLQSTVVGGDGRLGLFMVSDRFVSELVRPRQVEVTVRLERVRGIVLPASSVVIREGQTGIWLWYTEVPRWQPVHVRATVGDRVVLDGVPPAAAVVTNPGLLVLLGVR